MINMTESQVLEALRAALTEIDQGAYTTGELAELLDTSVQCITRQLRPLIKAGLVKCVRKRMEDITGRIRPVPAYRMVAP